MVDKAWQPIYEAAAYIILYSQEAEIWKVELNLFFVSFLCRLGYLTTICRYKTAKTRVSYQQ